MLLNCISRLLIFAFFLFSLSLDINLKAAELSSSLDPKKVDEVAHSRYWLRLLHYKPRYILRTIRSQLDGPDFFFSPEGTTDPKAELLATVDAFTQNIQVGKLKQHPRCAFPERYRFLKAEFNLQLPEIKCEKFEEYLSKFKANSASLVFSTAYPNNPGSMFGHTFLRIQSKTRPDLLDFGINYAASVQDDSNGFEFMFLGLTGGYRGQFSMLPYYSKVNEYVNSESRDIWEYDINLTEEETTRMLAHLWEIETNSWFNYYFFDENCAYQLMSALEIAKPEWDLSGSGLWVIPGETVKKLLAIPGAVREVKFRPSLRKKMLQRYSALTAEEKADFFELIHGERDVNTISKPLILDTASSYFIYLKQKGGGKLSDADSNLSRKTLIRRSELGSVSKTSYEASLPPMNEDSRPELGHFPSRIGITSGLQSGGDRGSKATYFQELSFKFAYHDLLNNDQGYIPFSQIDFPNITLRYIPESSFLYVENLTALSITSLFPLSFIEKQFSWRLLLDYYSPKDFGCTSCHAARFEGGGGLTFQLWNPKAILYTLLLADVEAGNAYQHSFRGGPKLQLASIINPIPQYKLRMAANAITDIAQSQRQNLFFELNLDQSYSLSQSFELRLNWVKYINTQEYSWEPYQDLKLSINYYF